MKNTRFFTSTASGTLWGRASLGLLLGASSGAVSAATVTVSDISSSVAGLFTGVTLSHVANGGTLAVDFTDFSAIAPGRLPGVGSPVPVATAFDTISFVLTAADGFLIQSLDYVENLVGTTSGGGFAYGTGSFTYNGTSVTLGSVFMVSGGGGQATGTLQTAPAIDLGLGLKAVTITITNSLLAAAFTDSQSASIAKTLAELKIGTKVDPIPVPAAAWLFGSALVGLATIGRRGSLS